MSDEHKLRKQMEEGVRAKSVLDSDAFKSAMASVRAAILDSWENCPIRDQEGAHELKLMLKIQKDFEGHLIKAVTSGEFAAAELKRDKTFAQMLQERLRIA